MPNTEEILETFGFTESVYGVEEETDICSHVETYKGWWIGLCIPNGGILAAVIFDTEKHDKAYSLPVGDADEDWEFYFDYQDDKGVIAHAKKAIDKVCDRTTNKEKS